ncbi:allantoate deiminase [Paenibacillus hamazuiensis]|uniref:allantoate deiminase n=1 Tax=Paenibacillus hamazuiensis TaxID=2936508 RepID=UPI00200F594F|nr:allantoate deiminase [Paenibacillus hamazuiensis]
MTTNDADRISARLLGKQDPPLEELLALDSEDEAGTDGSPPERLFARQATALLNRLGQFGADPEGGTSRLLYSPAWQNAQAALEEWMNGCGLRPYYDDAGNLFGRLEGTDPLDRGVILTGSHIDTVRRGGLYDGAYGVVGALIAVSYLQRKYGPPRRTLEVVSFAEEEGSRFPLTFWGSGNVTGLYDTRKTPDIVDAEGVTLADAMNGAGFGLKRYRPSRRSDVRAFIELHIEQGAVLERERKTIGIVQGIVGQKRFTFHVKGEANHAGTTPMSYRKDALSAACEMALYVREAALQAGDPLVATVGKLEASPGVANVVPGAASFTVDIRHAEAEALMLFCRSMRERFEQIAARYGVTVDGEEWMSAAPVPMSAKLTALLGKLCISRGLPYRSMYSGAGHDAQIVSAICPAAMVFVPSYNGISHSPHEFTSENDLAAGIVVLADLLYMLAYEGEAAI